MEKDTRAAPPRYPMCEICAPALHDDDASHYFRATAKLTGALRSARKRADEAEKRAETEHRTARGWSARSAVAEGALDAIEQAITCGGVWAVGCQCGKVIPSLHALIAEARQTMREHASEQPAAQPPPDSSAALLEARRLLGEALEIQADTDHPVGCDCPWCEWEIRAHAFLRSDSERSEHGKG